MRGIEGKPKKIINSNRMINLLNKEQWGVIAQLCSLEDPTSKSCISPDIQNVLDNHSKVFETPKGLPPTLDHDHAIHLIPRSVPPNIRPYIYPYAQRSGNSFKSCRRSQFKQDCENLTRKEKSYWNLKQSQNQESTAMK